MLSLGVYTSAARKGDAFDARRHGDPDGAPSAVKSKMGEFAALGALSRMSNVNDAIDAIECGRSIRQG